MQQGNLILPGHFERRMYPGASWTHEQYQPVWSESGKLWDKIVASICAASAVSGAHHVLQVRVALLRFILAHNALSSVLGDLPNIYILPAPPTFFTRLPPPIVTNPPNRPVDFSVDLL